MRYACRCPSGDLILTMSGPLENRRPSGISFFGVMRDATGFVIGAHVGADGALVSEIVPESVHGVRTVGSHWDLPVWLRFWLCSINRSRCTNSFFRIIPSPSGRMYVASNILRISCRTKKVGHLGQNTKALCDPFQGHYLPFIQSNHVFTCTGLGGLLAGPNRHQPVSGGHPRGEKSWIYVYKSLFNLPNIW